MKILPRHTLSLLAILTTAPLLTAAPAIDSAALEPLKRMSQTLSGASAFTYRSQTVFEVPAVNGQFITLFSRAEVALQRPNQLRARLTGEAPHFDFYYDGAKVSAFAPATKVYSSSAAPATIDAMLAGLRAETGIRFVTSGLLMSNPYATLTRGLTSAIVVGPTDVNGVKCTHLAFRSAGVNWEIWLEANAQALPRRLAVTFTDTPNFPRTLVELSHWNLRPWLWKNSFSFTPPAGAKQIPFTSVMKSVDR